MSKLDSQNISELERYFHPKAQVVDKLPDVKSVKDFAEVYRKNTDGTYNSYKMIAGKWINTAKNLTTE
jgi:hypothetical protein